MASPDAMTRLNKLLQAPIASEPSAASPSPTDQDDLDGWSYSNDLTQHYAHLFDRLNEPEPLSTSSVGESSESLSALPFESEDELDFCQLQMTHDVLAITFALGMIAAPTDVLSS